MDLNKHLEFFNPVALTDPVHIIGCGAIGSNLAEQLARLGVDNIHLYDFDIVDPHNITNQAYRFADIGFYKVGVLGGHLKEINPDIHVTVHEDGWTEFSALNGYVFLCVDNIDTRRTIVEKNKNNMNIKAMFDIRMRLEDAQAYAADWSVPRQVDNFLGSMQFTHEEAVEATPVSACGTTLSVAPTVWTVVSMQVANFINLIRKPEAFKNMILVCPFNYFTQGV